MKRSSTLCALAAVLCLTSGLPFAGAQGVHSKQTASLPSSPLHVELQNNAGSIEFFATGWPSALRIHGKGTGPDGTLTVKDSSVSGSMSVDLTSLETGIGLRDRHMKENYLQVDRYPRAVLTLRPLDSKLVPSGVASGPVNVPFEGTLLLHGVEKPVAGHARISRDADQVTANAVFSIKLGEFGIDVPKYLGITVAEKVEVKATFSAHVDRPRDVAER
ncbi:MAG: YceI family protein [Solirubrobacterales bacterium]|jgi:polyisoprenoid-binding protein YceI